jgi:hypothetical protein
MDRQTSRRFVRTLFWGAAWGLAESTLGALLHLVPVPGLAGIIMTPLGAVFMTLAFRETGRPDTALSVSAVAAVLKLSGFLLPGIAPGLILRPAAAILLEGLAASALLAAAPLLIRRKA